MRAELCGCCAAHMCGETARSRQLFLATTSSRLISARHRPLRLWKKGSSGLLILGSKVHSRHLEC
jgi:hypothetical protein